MSGCQFTDAITNVSAKNYYSTDVLAELDGQRFEDLYEETKRILGEVL